MTIEISQRVQRKFRFTEPRYLRSIYGFIVAKSAGGVISTPRLLLPAGSAHEASRRSCTGMQENDVLLLLLHRLADLVFRCILRCREATSGSIVSHLCRSKSAPGARRHLQTSIERLGCVGRHRYESVKGWRYCLKNGPPSPLLHFPQTSNGPGLGDPLPFPKCRCFPRNRKPNNDWLRVHFTSSGS